MAESNNKESNDTLQKLVSNALKEQESSLNFIDQMMNQLCDSFNKERVTENSLDKDAESEAYVDYEAAQPTDSEDEVSMGDLFGDLIGNDPDFMDTTGTPEEYDEDTGEDPSEVSSADSDYKFDDDNLEDGDELDPTEDTESDEQYEEEDTDNTGEEDTDELDPTEDAEDDSTTANEESTQTDPDAIISDKIIKEAEIVTNATPTDSESNPFGHLNMDKTPQKSPESNKKDEDMSDDELVAKEKSLVPKDVQEMIKVLKKSSFTGTIQTSIDSMTNTLIALYEGGFTSLPQPGIIRQQKSVATVLVRLVTVDGETKLMPETSEVSGYERNIIDTICSVHPVYGRYANITQESVVPNYDQLIIPDGVVCDRMHIMFQSANVAYSKGKTSIRRWVTEEMVPGSEYANSKEWMKANGVSTRLVQFKHVQKWYKWAMSNIFYEAVAKYCLSKGVRFTEQESYENGKIQKNNEIDQDSIKGDFDVNGLLNLLCHNLSNIVTLAEKSKDVDSGRIVSEEFRLCSCDAINASAIIDSIDKVVNPGVKKNIIVKQLTTSSFTDNNIVSIKVIYDPKSETKSDLFAYEIMSNIVESGGAPSWSRCLLGRAEDGTNLYWDKFMSDDAKGVADRCYAIYAGSRSGKGVMTSTLVASALVSGVHVFYTDGKPENGPTMGMMAWKQGKEAYVFDGKATGDMPFAPYMEDAKFTNGMRSIEEVTSYIDKLPKELFESEGICGSTEFHRKFAGIMRYLKSMCLCFSIIEGRSAGTLPKDKWNLWVFDEVSNTAKIEKEVRETFGKYIASKGISFDYLKDFNKLSSRTDLLQATTPDPPASPDGKKGPKKVPYDAGIDYIKKWHEWTKSILSLAASATTITLGKSDTNLIWIFQEASWLGDKDERRCTTLRNIITSLNCTKIVGKDALLDGMGVYGTNTTSSSNWYANKVGWKDKKGNGKGLWAICLNPDLRKCHSDDMALVFKPYKVWTIPSKNDNMVSFEELGLVGDKEVQQRKYFAGYINFLEKSLGFDAAQSLQDAYNYASEAAVTLGYAEATTGQSDQGGDGSAANVAQIRNNLDPVKKYIYNVADFKLQVDAATLEDTQLKAAALDNGFADVSDMGAEAQETDTLNGDIGFGGTKSSTSNGWDNTNDENDEYWGDKDGAAPSGDSTSSSSSRGQSSTASSSSDEYDPYNENEVYARDIRVTESDKIAAKKLGLDRIRKGADIARLYQSGKITDGMAKIYYENVLVKFTQLDYNLLDRSPQPKTNLMGLCVLTSNLAVLVTHRVLNKNLLGISGDAQGKSYLDLMNKLILAEATGSLALDTMPSEAYVQRILAQTASAGHWPNQDPLGANSRVNPDANPDMFNTLNQDQSQGQDWGDDQQDYDQQATQTQAQAQAQAQAEQQKFDTSTSIDLDLQNEEFLNSPEGMSSRNPYSAIMNEPTNMKASTRIDANGNIFLNPRNTQSVIQMPNTEDGRVIVAPKPPSYQSTGFFGNIHKHCFESRNGMSYEFKQMWDAIVDAIHYNWPKTGLITEMSLGANDDDMVMVNGILMPTDTIMNGQYNIHIHQLVNFKSLFKEFPYLQKLQIGNLVYDRLIIESDNNNPVEVISAVFKNNPRLMLLRVGGTDYTRSFLEDMKQQARIQAIEQRQAAKRSVELSCAQRNPRLHEKAPGYLLTVYDNGVHLGGKQFKKSYSRLFDDESPKLGAALGYSFLGTICVGVGLVGGALGGIGKLFSSKRQY